MKALVYTDHETLAYRDEIDASAKEGEELIKVSAVGICGSDLHAYHGLDERRLPPLILGHEISGINQTDNGPVVINPLITCGKCQECLNEREHICCNRELLGMTKPVARAGGFAEFVAAPSHNVFPVPSSANLQDLALTEPTAVAFHAIKISEQVSFKKIHKAKILIIGGGAIGLLLALVLKIKNAENVMIVDTNTKRLDVCKKASSYSVSHPDDDGVQNNNYDIVFDAAGFEATRKKSIQCVKQGGTIIHIGLSQPAGEFDFRKATLQEITFIGTYCYTNEDFRQSLNILIAKELGDLTWLDYRPLKDGAKAFREIHDSITSSPKIILLP